MTDRDEFRERHHIPDAGKKVENPTNHDAVPEAKDGESTLPDYCWDEVSPSHPPQKGMK